MLERLVERRTLNRPMVPLNTLDGGVDHIDTSIDLILGYGQGGPEANRLAATPENDETVRKAALQNCVTETPIRDIERAHQSTAADGRNGCPRLRQLLKTFL